MSTLRNPSYPVHPDPRGAALFDAHKLASEARDLRDGTGAYFCLTVSERNEQLAAMGLPRAATAPRFPGFVRMSDDALAGLIAACKAGEPLPLGKGEDRGMVLREAAAEVARRLNTVIYVPSDEERDEIEGIVACMEADGHDDPERWSGLE